MHSSTTARELFIASAASAVPKAAVRLLVQTPFPPPASKISAKGSIKPDAAELVTKTMGILC